MPTERPRSGRKYGLSNEGEAGRVRHFGTDRIPDECLTAALVAKTQNQPNHAKTTADRVCNQSRLHTP